MAQLPRCATSVLVVCFVLSNAFGDIASDAVGCLVGCLATATLAGVDLRAETGASLSFVLAVRHASW
jgi:isocitrate/isopropylmalate dehydrogenase